MEANEAETVVEVPGVSRNLFGGNQDVEGDISMEDEQEVDVAPILPEKVIDDESEDVHQDVIVDQHQEVLATEAYQLFYERAS